MGACPRPRCCLPMAPLAQQVVLVAQAMLMTQAMLMPQVMRIAQLPDAPDAPEPPVVALPLVDSEASLPLWQHRLLC